jgi:hypothetical protein
MQLTIGPKLECLTELERIEQHLGDAETGSRLRQLATRVVVELYIARATAIRISRHDPKYQ